MNCIIWAKVSLLIEYSSHEKAVFTITRSSKLHFLKFWRFNFSNFQTNFVKIFTKKRPGLQIYFESTDKVLRIHQYLWSKFLGNETTALWPFFEICTGDPFASQILSNKGNIKASVLLILLKPIVVGYSNGNESFTGRLFSNKVVFTGRLSSTGRRFRFFRYLIYSVFHETFVRKFMKKLSFFSSNFKKSISRCSILQKIKMFNFRILKWRPFEGKLKS